MNKEINSSDSYENDGRPSPDALLAVANLEEDTRLKKGKLKIFLGAAPGVGKTYAMLAAGHKAQDEGINVVVGIIETHGRFDTEKLIDGLTLVDRKKIIYKNKTFWELYIAKIIALAPQIVLVDELAHRNITGSTNNKRYQDIINLLDAGIDVYTTVNIQHLESIKDEIYQIIKVNVKETVPDSIFEIANETVVIDITPSELQQRLKEGKIYIPKEAERALDNYFSEANISALRAFALQIAAKSISKRVIIYKHAQGIKGSWIISEKVLVCISDSSLTPSLIRSAKRLAANISAGLVAIVVDSPLRTLSPKRAKKLNNHKRYAEHIGAEVVTLTSVKIAKSIITYARENNITHIVLSKSVQSRLAEFLIGSVLDDIIRHSGNISIHVINERPSEDRTNIIKRLYNKYNIKSEEKSSVYSYINSAILVAVSTYILYTFFIFNTIDVMAISLVFLLLVFFTAYKYCFRVSMFTAILCCISITFYFVNPFFKFNVSKATVIPGLIMFLIASYILNRFTNILKGQALRSKKREETITEQFKFSKKLAHTSTLNELLSVICEEFFVAFELPTALFLPKNGRARLHANYPDEIDMSTKAKAALHWSWKHHTISGYGTDTLSTSNWYFFPLKITEENIGIIGVNFSGEKSFFDTDSLYFFQALSDQSTLAIARLQLLFSNN